mgnify:CR=1 FL=1
MGLNFNKKVYDMNLVLCNNKLISMNYEDYIDKIDEKEIDFWDSLFDFPRRTLNAFILAFNFDSVKRKPFILAGLFAEIGVYT